MCWNEISNCNEISGRDESVSVFQSIRFGKAGTGRNISLYPILFNMNLTNLGELSLLLWVILLYNTTTAERNLIPVSISCHSTGCLDVDDELFSQSLHIGNMTITVDKDEPGVTNSSDLWNISVIGNFSRKPFLEGKGHVDCSLVLTDIKCDISGYFHGKYESQSYTPHIEYGVVNKTIRKTPQMLICEVVSGPTARQMRWQNMTGGDFEDILTQTKRQTEPCLVRTTSKLKYRSNTQYRCMFEEIEVGSITVEDINSGTEIDLSIHFFLSSITILYAPFLLHQLLPTGLLSRLTSNCPENLLPKVMAVTAWIPLILCAMFGVWWTILCLIWGTTDYLRFVILEVIFYGLHSVAHIICSLRDNCTYWTHLDKWRRALCFAAFINPVICWVAMRGQVEVTTALEIAWWFLTVICTIVQVKTQFSQIHRPSSPAETSTKFTSRNIDSVHQQKHRPSSPADTSTKFTSRNIDLVHQQIHRPSSPAETSTQFTSSYIDLVHQQKHRLRSPADTST
ncbi:uncharacterized protein LOC124263410 isoform X4 [Haliotis rubra]|uniref:uncharacterized protein LOC124263410 isoform X4 n=1 Tax=Haliotis rubra TaxID=36100 RepID=UPI001EE5111F|nr:uncharacterized protein LOC124263410 isoform X4 [Haliotis rubra]